MSLRDRDLTHSINVKGVWWGCKYAIQSMKKHGKGGSIVNTASMVAKVGSAAPQIACILILLMHIDYRYRFKRGCFGFVEGTCYRPCQGWNSNQFTLSWTVEYSPPSKLFGHPREETPSDHSFANRQIRYPQVHIRNH